MDRTEQIKEAHPWLSYEETVKVLIYHHQGSSWIQNIYIDQILYQYLIILYITIL